MAEVNVTVVGYAGTDPQLMRSKSDLAWTHFRVGTTKYARDGETGAWIDGPTLWFKVKAWGGKAQNVVDSVRKGTPVVVSGRLSVEPYTVTKDGGEGEKVVEHRLGLTIENAVIAIDLSRGVARYHRVERDLPEPADAPNWVRNQNGGSGPIAPLPYAEGAMLLPNEGVPDGELGELDGDLEALSGDSIGALDMELVAA